MFYEDKTIDRTSYSYRWMATCESAFTKLLRVTASVQLKTYIKENKRKNTDLHERQRKSTVEWIDLHHQKK